jgi:hypothetical protein
MLAENGGGRMLRIVLLALALLVLLGLIWLSAGRPSDGPGGEQYRKARERGGGWF